jgi:hypothetical protein
MALRHLPNPLRLVRRFALFDSYLSGTMPSIFFASVDMPIDDVLPSIIRESLLAVRSPWSPYAETRKQIGL